MSFDNSEQNINDLERILENDEEYDVIIYVGENENTKELHANSNILCDKSQYFRTAFSIKWANKEDGKFIFKKPNISPKLFEIILRYIYCEKIDLTKLQAPEMLKLIVAIDELDIQALIPNIQNYLIINHDEFLQQNLLEIIQMIYQYEFLTDLLNYCLNNILIIFNSNKFINLETHLLEFLLKYNDLNLDEIEIWEYLIKWGLTQEQKLNNKDVSKWKNDDINNFKMILDKFIPLIRFYGIPLEDYFEKIKPYEKILPKELQDEILKFNTGKPIIQDFLPPRYHFDSTLVNRKCVPFFKNWIDKKEQSAHTIISPYRFSLLYRASRDGNTAAEFHNKCDNKGATIVIAKVANSNHIVGGYNPLFWDSSNRYKCTNDSFIFSFKDSEDLRTARVNYISGDCNQFSIMCNQSHGPTFGFGHDLSFQYNNTTDSVSYIQSYCNSSYTLRSNIDIPVGSGIYGYTKFHVIDYEVFKVIKN